METNVLAVAVIAGLSIFAEPVLSDQALVYAAGDCSAAAQQVVSKTGGKLLSAQQQGNVCVITVLVPGNGGPPQKVTTRVPI